MKTATSWVPFGFLPIFKPAGPTSHDIVAKVRRLLPRGVKVGHTGTLDPFATGVLILGLGKATKFSDAVHELPKTYRALVKLGSQTDTLDPTGKVVEEVAVPKISATTLQQVSAAFLGSYEQMPPIFSAKKVGGRKSYELARRNEAVTLEARTVQIQSLHLEQVNEDTLMLRTTCSTGTYVRSLGRDIAQKLGTVGYLIELEREAVGPITSDACLALDALTVENLPQNMVPVAALLSKYPEIKLPKAAYSHFVDGRSYRVRDPLPSQFLAVFEMAPDQVGAIFRCDYRPDENLVAPRLLCYLNPQLQT